MKLIQLQNKYDGYLHLYEAEYENNDGGRKKYEVVSRQKELTPDTMGQKLDGVMIVPIVGERVLLSKEFRIPTNRFVYNFPAGLIDRGETVQEAAVRELKEETGLDTKEILFELPAAYSTAGMTDERVAVVFVKATGEILGSDNVNEEIYSQLYTREELQKLVETSEIFCSKTQLACLYLLAKTNF